MESCETVGTKLQSAQVGEACKCDVVDIRQRVLGQIDVPQLCILRKGFLWNLRYSVP